VASNRSRSKNTLGTRMVSMEIAIEDLAARTRTSPTTTTDERIAYLEEKIDLLLNPQWRLDGEVDLIDERYGFDSGIVRVTDPGSLITLDPAWTEYTAASGWDGVYYIIRGGFVWVNGAARKTSSWVQFEKFLDIDESIRPTVNLQGVNCQYRHSIPGLATMEASETSGQFGFSISWPVGEI
jgi:hypothetical protein